MAGDRRVPSSFVASDLDSQEGAYSQLLELGQSRNRQKNETIKQI